MVEVSGRSTVGKRYCDDVTHSGFDHCANTHWYRNYPPAPFPISLIANVCESRFVRTLLDLNTIFPGHVLHFARV